MKTLDNTQWVEAQFAGCELGDLRRTKRLSKVASSMLDCPEQSLPKQNSQWGDLKAAYRLFDTESVNLDSIATPHWHQTRCTKAGRYLLISDTTDLSYKSHKATKGLGILGDGRGRGLQLHNCLAYSCDDQQIVGMAGAMLYKRKKVRKGETRAQRLKRIRESRLWGDLVEKVGCPPEGSKWIHVFDRGGDNFEAMCQIKKHDGEFVIRAAKLNRTVINEENERVSLKEAIKDARHLGNYELQLRSRQGVAARIASLEVSSIDVRFPLPAHRSVWLRQCGIKEIKVSVVIVQEVDAPKGVKPIRWVLLCSEPVKTFNDAWQRIDDYERRWLVEEYHKVIKSGCNIEGHSLRNAGRLEALIGLISVIGIRIFQLKLIGRNQPTAKASTHVPAKWLTCLKRMRPRIRLSEMTVYTFFRELAKLGGFLGRKSDGEPGWQTIWYGYQKLHSRLDGMEIANAI